MARFGKASDHRREAKGERRMRGAKIVTTVYIILFVLMILIAIGSLLGLFENHLIDPGL